MRRVFSCLVLVCSLVAASPAEAAATVTASLSSAGDLVVRGTDDIDEISIGYDEFDGELSVFVRNDLTSEIFLFAETEVTRDIRIVTEDGADRITTPLARRDLKIDLGNGDDVLYIDNSLGEESIDLSELTARHVSVKLGSGHDSFEYDGIGVTGNFTLDAGGGNDEILGYDTYVLGNLSVKLVSGQNRLDLTNGIDSGPGVLVLGKTTIRGGAAADYVDLGDPILRGKLSVNMGGQADHFSLSSNENAFEIGDISYVGGSGNDSVVVAGAGGAITGSHSWNGSAGADTIDFVEVIAEPPTLKSIASIGDDVSPPPPQPPTISVSSAGDLVVRGTDAADEIVVQVDEFLLATVSWTIDGLTESQQVTGLERDVRIITEGGDDIITVDLYPTDEPSDDIDWRLPGSLRIDTGDGDDRLAVYAIDFEELSDWFEIDNDLSIKMGNGDDRFMHGSVVVNDDATIDMGSGDDVVTGEDLVILDKMIVKLGAGNNLFEAVREGDDSGGDIAVVGKASIVGGSGVDTIRLSDPYFESQLKVSLGSGDDRFETLSSTGDSQLGIVSFNGGSGDDVVKINVTDIVGKNVWNGGSGDDTIAHGDFVEIAPTLKSITRVDF